MKLVFLDIDGTLTEGGSNTPPASALEAIRQAKANGHKVFICSGRNYGMLKPILQYGFDGYIASAGGTIVCGDTLVYDCPMTPEQQERVLTAFEDSGVYCTLECREESYCDPRILAHLENKASETGNSEMLRQRRQVEKALGLRPLSDYSGEPIYKVVFMTPLYALPQNLLDALENEFQFCIQNFIGLRVNGELINRKFNKGTAIKKVCAFLNVPIEDTIAIGDSMNDLEMIQAAGVGICMGNGHEALKALADEVCPALENDGIYHAFEMHGLL